MEQAPLVLTLLYLVVTTGTGYIGEKLVDILGKPIWKWLSTAMEAKEQFNGFAKAYQNSRELLLEKKSIQEPTRTSLYDALGILTREMEFLDEAEGKEERAKLQLLASKLEGAAFIEGRPDISSIAELLDFIIRFQAKNKHAIPLHELEPGITFFIQTFQDQLFLQPSFEDVLLKRRQWQHMKLPLYNTRANYLEQVVKQHQSLDFVGIPELKDRNALQLREIYIQLRAEVGSYTGHHSVSAERSQRLSVNDALIISRQIVILGDPGAGKTTMLKFITLAYAQNQAATYLDLPEQRLPLFIRLSDYVAKRAERSTDYSFLDYLNTFARENLLLNLAPDFFETYLSSGEACVCFDGLDELGNISLRREITSMVAAFVNRFRDNLVIVTSRSVGYYEAPLDRREFMHYTVLPFTDDDIKSFVNKWYLARVPDALEAQELARQLIKTIMDEPRIKVLATNPLLLTIIALVHRIEAELPHERVKLYEKCVSALIETWEKVKKVYYSDKERPFYKHRRRLLEQIAFWLHSQSNYEDDILVAKAGTLKLQIVRFLTDYPTLQLDEELAWQEADAFIDLIRSRTGLLIERGTEKGEEVYAFAHQTFQEYLTASDIRKRLIHKGGEEIWTFIRENIHKPSWREVLLLLLGSLNEFDNYPTIVIEKMLTAGQTDRFESVVHRYLFLAAQALIDHVEVSVSLRKKIIDKLIDVVVSDQVGASNALQMLRLFQGDEYVIQSLVQSASDSSLDEWTRIQVVSSIGEIAFQKAQAVQELTKISSNTNEPWELRYHAAYALGRMGKVGKAVRLLQELESTDLTKLMYYLKTSNLAQFPPFVFVNEENYISYVSLEELNEAVASYRRMYKIEPDYSELTYHDTDIESMHTLSPATLIDIVKDPDATLQARLGAARLLSFPYRVSNQILTSMLEVAEDRSIERQLRSEVATALSSLLAVV